ncbi:MAG: DUF1846 domain-containing protein [Clostridiales bacterium]|jgi:uncharacterized protein (UPF0371 family)|nr:DUF1846 domain-containing protein [Clostridiales bacterium]
MPDIGFDSRKYLNLQTTYIKERIEKFGNKLYLEFGGKLFDDFHAQRVLPGFEADFKVRMLATMADKTEIVLVINSADIDTGKARGDSGITYDEELLRLADAFTGIGLYVGSVVITRYSGEKPTKQFAAHLRSLGMNVYRHYHINDYPTNANHVLSSQGFGKNEYIKTEKPLVVVTAPGPGSGKMATCLSQLYHENLKGVRAGYAKFETFPIWNLPINHPLNLAYESATVDLDDVNMIDPFHLEHYGETAVSYNRDIEGFTVLNAAFKKIWGESPYNSPTDMGVNMIGYCIKDDSACVYASKQEIIRRFYNISCDILTGRGNKSALTKMELLMSKADTSSADRPVIAKAKEKSLHCGTPAVAIMLPDKSFVTGKTSSLLGASAAALLNALKVLAGIDDEHELISPEDIVPIQKLKVGFLGNKNPRLHTDEVLIALSINSNEDKAAKAVFEQLPKLKNSEVHSTVMLSTVDINVFKNLGMNVTCEAKYENNSLYHKR